MRNHFTPTQAQAKVRDPEYLAEIRRRMRDDPIGRANVPPEIVTALIDALETARESNRHNFAVARAALGVVGPPPNQTTDEVGALGQRAYETRGGES